MSDVRDFKYESGDVLKSFKKLKAGETIPREGPCSFFYEVTRNAGDTFVVSDKGDAHACHIDHDQDIRSLDPEKYSWSLSDEGGRKVLTLIFRDADGPSHIIFTINPSASEGRAMIKILRKRKKLKVSFIAIACGELVKEMEHDFILPRDVLKGL